MQRWIINGILIIIMQLEQPKYNSESNGRLMGILCMQYVKRQKN